MGWFRRQNEGGDDRAAENGVASDLARFLVHATEGRALRQAITHACPRSQKRPPIRPANETVTGIVAGPASPGSSHVAGGERE
jgi:hypothetical protein